MIQEHHARRLHWDLRLERDGVLVSWALPRGVPLDPSRNRLAIHTEDHPLDYFDFEGEIPAGNYGAGTVTRWDSGTYEAEKFRGDEVIVTLRGERVEGRYALFQTDGRNWMIHRMDPPPSGHEPFSERIEPMKATLAELPREDRDWAFEIKWDGVRAIAYCQPGKLRLQSRTMKEITGQYPEIAALLLQLEGREALLDGEIVAFDEEGKPSFQRLQRRMHVASDAEARRRRAQAPVTYVIFDLLHLDGTSLLGISYEARRARLEELGLDGDAWQTPSFHRGDGERILAATRERGLEGVIAKRLASPYRAGKRSRDWLKIKNVLAQEVVIGGWLPGRGRRDGVLGALAVGVYDHDREQPELRYVGKVGTGFGDAELRRLGARLEPLSRPESPFDGRQPEKGTRFVDPDLVAEVAFGEWTHAGTLRHPVYKGLRDDVSPRWVVRERPQEPGGRA